ncbi:prepilin-type N-terminal cleavage/methylation domain-containing protein [Paenibacillus dokdonensis]|uniref:Prepilin-type N-terminal cleavage/methylation domain-containing protein n=1 Tax=Paenibacillus dokdonensis TaxID=2567944 RepID=A0ABU6GNX5_9BACL|nr:prepilin-type N-terminal cleavage/methylation domain-containing protein [Paenibacillus dokdonensis]MEC0241445.1 prepilin-type N-terminal cleavage/methylation domain-containing protein [Paenibacillus dokdonensis]
MEAVMKKRFGRLGREEKGFTLIELLAVIVIIGIIAVIAVPLISNVMNKSRDSADVATAKQVYDAARLYVTNELNGDFSGKTTEDGKEGTSGTLTITVAALKTKEYLDKELYLPSNKKTIDNGTVVFKAGKLDSVELTTGTGEGTKLGTFKSSEVLSSKKEEKTTAPPSGT